MTAHSILRWSGRGLAFLLAVLSALFGFVQFGPGKALLARSVEMLASSDNFKIKVAGITGFIPTDMAIEQIVVADADGPYAEIAGLNIAWHPLALLRGTLAISHLGADKVTVLRRPRPAPEGAAAAHAQPAGGLALPRIVVTRFAIPEIEIGEAAVGQHAVLSAEAAIDLVDPAHEFALSLNVMRRDAPGRLKADVRLVAEGQRLDADMAAYEPPGGLVSRLAGLDDLPAVELKIAGNGPLDQWDGVLSADAGAAARIEGRADVRRTAQGHRVAFNLEAFLGQLSQQARLRLLEGKSTLAGVLTIDEAWRAEIASIDLKSPVFEAAMHGTIDGPSQRADLQFMLNGGDATRFATRIPNISWDKWQLSGSVEGLLAQPEIQGALTISNVRAHGVGARKARFSAAVSTGADFSKIELKFDGEAHDLTLAKDGTDRPLSAVMSFAGHVTKDANGLALRALAIDFKELNISAAGALGPTTANLTARLQLDDLSKLGAGLQGKAGGEATINGKFDQIHLSARLAWPSGAAMGRPVRDVALSIEADDLTGQTRATAVLTGSVANEPVKGLLVFATPEHGNRVIQDVELAVGSATAKGAATITARSLLHGSLTVMAGDLRRLSPLAMASLAGRAKMKLMFDADGGKQRVRVDGMAEQVKIDALTLQSARLDMTAIDPIGALSLNGRLEAAGFETGAVSVSKAALVARPSRDGTDFTLDGSVQGGTLAAAATLSRSDSKTVLKLAKLRYAKAPHTIALAGPATLAFGGGNLTLDQLALALDTGRATLRLRSGTALEAALDLRDVPLALTAIGDAHLALSGTLSGGAKLAGTASAPTGSYNFAVAKFNTQDWADMGGQPLDIKARGALKEQKASVDVTVAGRSIEDFSIRGSVPFGSGDLDLAVKGKLGLELANALLATSGARAGGAVTVNTRITGPAKAPKVAGQLRLTNGTFTDVQNGLTLKGIEASLSASERTITIEQLAARTANGGSITGRGTVHVDPAAGFPGNVEIAFQNAALVSSQTINLVGDGRITLSGALASKPKIGGKLDIKRLEIDLSDTTSNSVAKLDVRHVNAPDDDVTGSIGSATRAARTRPRRRAGKAGQRAVGLGRP